MKNQPHRHVSMDALQEQIRESIDLQGFALRHVLASATEPAFSYTVGLHVPMSERPELFISGLSIEARVSWLLGLGFRIQGPPPLETRKRMAREQHVPLNSLVFPKGGQVFLPGVRYGNLAENDLPTCFGQVEAQYYDAYFGQALAFHQTPQFPVLQMVWGDRLGKFPWENGFERQFEKKQRLLFDHRLSLPLKDSQA